MLGVTRLAAINLNDAVDCQVSNCQVTNCQVERCLGYSLDSLGLMPVWKHRISNLTRHVETMPTRSKPYLELVMALSHAKHAEQMMLDYGRTRRLQYLMVLLEQLLIAALVAPDEDLLLWHRSRRLLDMHQIVSSKLHAVVFQPVADKADGSLVLQQQLQEQVFRGTSPGAPLNHLEINVAIMAVGNYGYQGAATLRSVLSLVSRSVLLYVLSDDRGWQGIYEVFKGLPVSLQNRATLLRVAFLENPQYLSLIDALPSACKTLTRQYDDLWPWGYVHNAQNFLHEILPVNVSRVVFLDIGDTIAAGDISEAWAEFDMFRKREIVAMAVHNGGAVERHREIVHQNRKPPPWNSRLLKLRSYEWFTAMNPSGFSLWDLEKARVQNFTAIVFGIVKSLGPNACYQNLACMDIATQVFRRRPDLWRDLSSVWNFYTDNGIAVNGALQTWATMDMTLSWDGHLLPEQVREHRLPFGLLRSVPLVMENPCPPTPLLLASTLLRFRGTWDVQLQAYWKDVLLSWGPNYVKQIGHGRIFSADVFCGTRVKFLHVAGGQKNSPWARKLFDLWAEIDYRD